MTKKANTSLGCSEELGETLRDFSDEIMIQLDAITNNSYDHYICMIAPPLENVPQHCIGSFVEDFTDIPDCILDARLRTIMSQILYVNLNKVGLDKLYSEILAGLKVAQRKLGSNSQVSYSICCEDESIDLQALAAWLGDNFDPTTKRHKMFDSLINGSGTILTYYSF
jgi:hypothetical protein